MEFEELRTKWATTWQSLQELLLEKLETQKGQSSLHKRIHSLECDIEVYNIKVRNMKGELEAAKKAHTTLESKLKNRKNEIIQLKQDLNKTRDENEVFKRVLYDSKMDMSNEK